MISRRSFLGSAAGAVLGTAAGAAPPRAPLLGGEPLRDAVARCERDSGGRLGVAVLDTSSGRRFAWRGDELFPLCSTFKFLLAAEMLRRVDRGDEQLERKLPVRAADIIDVSPFTGRRAGGHATIGELCRATMIFSDNAAANLLLAVIGGPAGITRFARALGDRTTRLDRNEPMLGECLPGDPRDTTSPSAMLHVMDRILLGKTLRPASRDRLIGWMVDNRTGAGKLRAGFHDGWRIGDKTGGGMHGTSNDIAIVWPASGPPLLVASYLTGTRLDVPGRNAVHATVARAIARAVAA